MPRKGVHRLACRQNLKNPASQYAGQLLDRSARAYVKAHLARTSSAKYFVSGLRIVAALRLRLYPDPTHNFVQIREATSLIIIKMHLASTITGQALIGRNTAAFTAKRSSRACHQQVSATIQEPPVSKKDLRKPRDENVDAAIGFYVDHTCIDCDTCR